MGAIILLEFSLNSIHDHRKHIALKTTGPFEGMSFTCFNSPDMAFQSFKTPSVRAPDKPLYVTRAIFCQRDFKPQLTTTFVSTNKVWSVGMLYDIIRTGHLRIVEPEKRVCCFTFHSLFFV